MRPQDEWWFPKLVDDKYVAQLRIDCPEYAEWDDAGLRSYFCDNQKYATTWDHVGDAYEEYEQLADAYLALLQKFEDQQ